MAKRTRIVARHKADSNNEVLSLKSTPGARHVYRREPCEQCPWRTDAIKGAFPAEAYRVSARTCTDMAESTFACHMSGKDRPATCAGFLLSVPAQHNMQVRLLQIKGEVDLRKVSSPVPTYRTYQEMAVANGVDPDDPAIADCRVR